MQKALHTKAMEKTLTTFVPFPRAEPTVFQMPVLSLSPTIAASLATTMEVYVVKQVEENARPRPAYNDDATYRPGAFSGLFKEKK